MEHVEKVNSPLLSIVIDDFDSTKKCKEIQKETPSGSSSKSIQKILEEAEHRKLEFWKLIEEHRAVVENLKKIEKKPTFKSSCVNTKI